MDTIPPENKLQQRGINVTAQAAGWHFYSLYGRAGYRYPVHHPGGITQRWKAFDGKKPKYAWLPSKPADCKYYLPQGVEALCAAVATADGGLYIANGEPALLAYLAAGVQNAVCWFGEGQPPRSLAADLRGWGVQTVRYPVDKDDAGEKSALKVRDALKDSGIAFYPLQWGADVPHKGDANDAWIAAGFDAGRFVAALHDLGALVLPTEAPEPRKADHPDRSASGSLKRDEAIAEVIRMAEARPGSLGRTKTNGDWLNFCCLLHDEHEPSAGINTKTGAYTCFVCGSVKLYEVCERLGIDYTPYQPPALTKGAGCCAPTIKPAPQPVQIERADPVFELKTIRQYGLLMCCSRETALVACIVQKLGIAGAFTVREIAQAVGKSEDTVQRWIDAGRRWGIEETADFTGSKKDSDSIPVKNAGRHYRLNLDATWSAMTDNRNGRLRDHLQELLEAAEPDAISRDAAMLAGLSEAEAAQLEEVTEEISQSLDAFEVRAKAERAAERTADKLLYLAEVDTNLFLPDRLPTSVSELSALLIEALHATDPDRAWIRRDFRFAAGVKLGSIGSLLKKTSLVPAEKPTFVDVPLEGQDLRRAVRVCCREHRGAAVAWLDENGEIISGMSSSVPKAAKAVRLNVGKKYTRRDGMTEERTQLPPSFQDEKTPAPSEKAGDSASQDAHAQRKARALQMTALRGCAEARGWRLVSGPFGYWERDNQTFDNSWEGLVEALLLDYKWAAAQRLRRIADEDPLVQSAMQDYGASVRPVQS